MVEEYDRLPQERTVKSITLWEFFLSEAYRDYYPEDAEETFEKKRKQVFAFVSVPKNFESFVRFGFVVCLDSLLYVFSFLPLHCLYTVVRFVTLLLFSIVSRLTGGVLVQRPSTTFISTSGLCDLVRAFLISFSLGGLLLLVDTSALYHAIRMQSTIKLYILFNMLEQADRLLSSFSQDVLDTLCWTVMRPEKRKRDTCLGLLIPVVMAMAFVSVHTFVVLTQATVLSMSINSHSKAFLLILISNNFAEVKSSVFKVFNRKLLFQVSCWDVRERFHYVVLFVVVVTRNLHANDWDIYHLIDLAPSIVAVFLVEVVIDWIKHCFLIRFNSHDADVYKEYIYSIAYDIQSAQEDLTNLARVDQVSRRMQLPILPLAILLLNVIFNHVSLSCPSDIIKVILFYLCLLATATVTGIYLVGRSYSLTTLHKIENLDRAVSESARASVHVEKPHTKDDMCLNNYSKVHVKLSSNVDDGNVYDGDYSKEIVSKLKRIQSVPHVPSTILEELSNVEDLDESAMARSDKCANASTSMFRKNNLDEIRRHSRPQLYVSSDCFT